MNAIHVSAPPLTALRSVLLVLLVGALLGRLGPFGTFADLPPAERYAYWIGLTLLMWLQTLAALQLLRLHTQLRWLRRAVAGAMLGALPTAFEVAWAEDVLRVERDLGPTDLLAIYGDVLLLALPLALLFEWANLRTPAPASTPAAQQPAAITPSDWRSGVIALAAEDHYLRIYREGGSELVLKRFGDALAEVEPLGGVQVHRSWWVRRDAVVGREQEGQRVTLELRGGVKVPVSRTYLLQAREAGLCD